MVITQNLLRKLLERDIKSIYVGERPQKKVGNLPYSINAAPAKALFLAESGCSFCFIEQRVWLLQRIHICLSTPRMLRNSSIEP